MKKTVFNMVLALIGLVSFWSCTDELKDLDGSSLIEQNHLAGEYFAQITPAFMGIAPVTTDTYNIKLDKVEGGKLRLHYKRFRDIHRKGGPKMPFEMTVDITMNVKKGPNNTIVLEGKKGLFRADPPEGSVKINPEDVPSGISLPEGAEGGMISHEASIEGTYGKTERDDKLANRFELRLTPGLPLPVKILIYTHKKIKN